MNDKISPAALVWALFCILLSAVITSPNDVARGFGAIGFVAFVWASGNALAKEVIKRRKLKSQANDSP
jgi:hypothetical protein